MKKLAITAALLSLWVPFVSLADTAAPPNATDRPAAVSGRPDQPTTPPPAAAALPTPPIEAVVAPAPTAPIAPPAPQATAGSAQDARSLPPEKSLVCDSSMSAVAIIDFADSALKMPIAVASFTTAGEAHTYLGGRQNAPQTRLVSLLDACKWFSGFMGAYDNRAANKLRLILSGEAAPPYTIPSTPTISADTPFVGTTAAKICEAVGTGLVQKFTIPAQTTTRYERLETQGGCVVDLEATAAASGTLKCELAKICAALQGNKTVVENLLMAANVRNDRPVNNKATELEWTSLDSEAASTLESAMAQPAAQPVAEVKEESGVAMPILLIAGVAFLALVAFLVSIAIANERSKSGGQRKRSASVNQTETERRDNSGATTNVGSASLGLAAVPGPASAGHEERVAIGLLVQIMGHMMQRVGMPSPSQFADRGASTRDETSDTTAQRLFTMLRQWDNFQETQNERDRTQYNELYRQFNQFANELEVGNSSLSGEVAALKSEIEALKKSIDELRRQSLEAPRLPAPRGGQTLTSMAPQVLPPSISPKPLPATQPYVPPQPSKEAIARFLEAVLPMELSSERDALTKEIINLVAPGDNRDYVIRALTVARRTLHNHHKKQKTSITTLEKLKVTAEPLQKLIQDYHQTGVLEVDDGNHTIGNGDVDNHLGDLSTRGYVETYLLGLRASGGANLVQPIYLAN